MPVKVSFKFNTAQTVMKVEGAAKRAIAETAQKVLDDCNEYVPNDQGELVSSSESSSDIPSGKLVWNTPSARFLYHGILMIDPKTGSPFARKKQYKIVKKPEVKLKYYKGKNGKAGSHWCERAEADHGEEWKNIYEETFGKELKK